MPLTKRGAQHQGKCRAWLPAGLPLILLVLLPARITCGQSAANRGSSDASSRTLVTFDATQPIPKIHALAMKMGGASPNGHEVQVNNRYLSLDGEPWLPVMGEFHYSRYPAAEWEDELLKMKAAGVNIVSTYVIWIHHEEIKGQYDWSGSRDLRHFVELCAKHGLFLFLRIGPYVHGEVRNGGLPDWLRAEGPVRRNTPEYLGHVRRFDGEIGRQVRGMLWKEGGPILGIQIENEYLLHGKDAGAAHISALKQIALQSGIDAPLFTVTGWGGADFPAGEVLPVHGVYPDAFWESTLKELPPSDAYLFDLRRDPGGILVDPSGTQKTEETRLSESPMLLAEAGGGMQVAYHRRPAIHSADVGAILVTHLGAGANLYGYYLFHGGSNPVGQRSTFQESAAIDGVYDLPVISYDFQAPLGEFGQVRPSYRSLKLFHFFLNEFGSELAPMVPVAPDLRPQGPGDRETPRVVLRSDGEHGFFFLNNYLRDYPMAEQKRLRFRVRFKNKTIEFPRQPIDVPSGAYFIWPVNLDMQGIALRYVTAQLICSLASNGARYYFFFAIPGVRSEFSFDAASVASVQVAHGTSTRADDQILVEGIAPGSDVALSLSSTDGEKIHIVVLSADQARDFWRTPLAGQERGVLSPADLFSAGDTVYLRSRVTERLSFAVFPSVSHAPSSATPLFQESPNGIFAQYDVHVPPQTVNLHWAKLRQPDPSSPTRMGKYNALAPTDADFAKAGAWRIEIPQQNFSALSEIFLAVDYRGDAARLYEKQRLLADNFYSGSIWEIGLKRFLAGNGGANYALKVLPLRKDAPIYLPAGAWPKFPAFDEIAEVKQISLVPEYQVVVHF